MAKKYSTTLKTNSEKHIPKKQLGQHFLHDVYYIERILESLDLSNQEQIVEIGPGLGALTKPILETNPQCILHAIEVDKDIVLFWENQKANYPNLILHHSDILDFDFGAYFPSNKKIKIVGNLPYNISTPILFHLFKFKAQIAEMIFMVQKEVGDRIVAIPNNKQYGRLSVMTQALCHVKKLFNVPPGAFNPPPKVQSCVISLIPYSEQNSPYPSFDSAFLENWVRHLFLERRKTLKNRLKSFPGLTADKIDLIFQRVTTISPNDRPENLTVAEIIALANMIQKE